MDRQFDDGILAFFRALISLAELGIAQSEERQQFGLIGSLHAPRRARGVQSEERQQFGFIGSLHAPRGARGVQSEERNIGCVLNSRFHCTTLREVNRRMLNTKNPAH